MYLSRTLCLQFLFLLLTCIILFVKVTVNRNDRTNVLKPLYRKLKYILTWTEKGGYPLSSLKTGQQAFIEGNCPFVNCYVTDQRDFFGSEDNVTRFDVIVFNEHSHISTTLPRKRDPHQIYIYINMESADNYPICNPIFDDFFNWTATYKLNSDVVYSYIVIQNNNGDEVGPKIDMTWINQTSEINDTLRDVMKRKNKAVAWFVSHCVTLSKREEYTKSLKKELEKQNLSLDIYGPCGDKTCPRSKNTECQNMLKENYYFYLSFENSFSEDYITEKLLTALLTNNVPILFGGADYSRFLPPGSYLDARQHTPEQLALLISRLIRNPLEYYAFFRWKNYYKYSGRASVVSSSYACTLCAALNNKSKTEAPQVYQEFRRWWHPKYRERCGKMKG